MVLPLSGLPIALRPFFLRSLQPSSSGWARPLKVRRSLRDLLRESLRGFLLVAPGSNWIHAKHSLGYSTMLDHSAETLTLLDQSLQDVHPVEDFNGAPYPSFAQVCFLEVLHWANTN